MKKKLTLVELKIQSFLTRKGKGIKNQDQFAGEILGGACSFPYYCPFPCSNHPICE